MAVHADSRDRVHSAVAMRFTIRDCSLGLVLVAQSVDGISAVLLGDDRETLCLDLHHRFPHVAFSQGGSPLDSLAADVVSLIESPARILDTQLDMHGTDFQRDVWSTLRAIPGGSTVTYTDIANRIGRPGSVRAVAGACAANPLAVIVPCHRVLRRDGQLGGYRWGIERKRTLLAREAASLCSMR